MDRRPSPHGPSGFEDFFETEKDLLAEIDLVCEDQDDTEYKCTSEYNNPPGCRNMSCECFGATDCGSIAWFNGCVSE